MDDIDSTETETIAQDNPEAGTPSPEEEELSLEEKVERAEKTTRELYDICPHTSEKFFENRSKIEELIRKGANLNFTGYVGITPTHYLVQYADEEFMRLMDENGADWLTGDNSCTPSLWYANNSQNETAIRYLYENHPKLFTTREKYSNL